MIEMTICAGDSHEQSGQDKKNRTYLECTLKRTAPPADLHTFVLDSIDITKPFESRGARFFGRHAAFDVFMQQQVNMKTQLFFNFPFCRWSY